MVFGEYDVIDGLGVEYFGWFGKVLDNCGYYSFDYVGVYFIGFVNVMYFKLNGFGSFGDE